MTDRNPTDSPVDPQQAAEPAPGPEQDLGDDPAMQSLSRALSFSFTLLKGLMLVAVILFFLSGFFTVEEGTRVLVQRFGAYRTSEGRVLVLEPGQIYYAVPIIDKVETVRQQTFTVELDRAFTALPQPTSMSQAPPSQLRPGADGYTVTGDANIIHSTWSVDYQVTDPYNFLTSVVERATGEVNPQTGRAEYRAGPEQFLREITQNAVVRVTAGTPVDAILTDGRERYRERVQQEIESTFAAYPIGVEVVAVQLTSNEPPAATKAAFDQVLSATVEKRGRISEAKAKRSTLLSEAGSKAARIINEAEIYRKQVVESAASDAQNVRDLLAEFPNDPEGLTIYLRQYHRELLADVLAGADTYLVRPGQSWYFLGPVPEDIYGTEE
jgi:modulator of FtsH protease HflK